MSKNLPPQTREWLEATGFTVVNEELWVAALTHGSMGEKSDYERLEFLRVLRSHVPERVEDPGSLLVAPEADDGAEVPEAAELTVPAEGADG